MAISKMFAPSAGEGKNVHKIGRKADIIHQDDNSIYLNARTSYNICLKDGSSVVMGGVQVSALISSKNPWKNPMSYNQANGIFEQSFKEQMKQKLEEIFEGYNKNDAKNLIDTWQTGQSEDHRKLRGIMSGRVSSDIARQVAGGLGKVLNGDNNFTVSIDDPRETPSLRSSTQNSNPCNMLSNLSGPTGMG